jgi:hypothetical protein
MARGRYTVKTVPYRNSSEPLPRIKRRRDRNKACFYEYGNDYDENTGKWTLYLDIIHGNHDLIDYVGFKFSSEEQPYNVRNRFPITLSDGLDVHRFILKRSSFPDCKRINITIFGRGGTRSKTSGFRAEPTNLRERSLMFVEWRELRPYYVTAANIDFGVEFEMSCLEKIDHAKIADCISRYANVSVKDCTGDYRLGKEKYDGWKLVSDGSLFCSPNSPNCSKFELVSPILNGESGLDECKRVLEAVKKAGTVDVNKSMGLHVHISVEDLHLEQKKNACLNFVKYENEIDSFMPPSRRDSSNNIYCKSNRDAISQNGNGRKHSAIIGCKTIDELCDVINPEQNRYLKLNLQNLRTQRQPTMEFRQHSSTGKFEKVEAWVRFCTRLVHNSTTRPPSLKPNDDAFELLFDTVIQDIKLKEFYRQRKIAVAGGVENANDSKSVHQGQCCGGCAKGHACEN